MITFYRIEDHNIFFDLRPAENAPSVVFLHHGLGSTYAWKNQIPDFFAAGYEIFAYDRWGYGLSDPREKFSMPTFEEDIDDLYVLMGEFIGQKAILIGHSDGATIALYFAIRYPERVVSLITIAAHAYVEETMGPGIAKLKWSYEHDPAFRKGLQAIHGDKADRVFYNWYNGWHNPDVMDWDMRPELKSISCPTLVIQGAEDEHATPKHAQEIAELIPGAELWLAKNADHMFPQKQPQRFNLRVQYFLKSVGLGSAAEEKPIYH